MQLRHVSDAMHAPEFVTDHMPDRGAAMRTVGEVVSRAVSELLGRASGPLAAILP